MSALDDAARAVDRASAALLRELRQPTEWISGEHGCDDRESGRLVTDLIAAVRLHDTELARAEALHDDTGTPEDEAYNQAIGDAANAIAARNAEEQT